MKSHYWLLVHHGSGVHESEVRNGLCGSGVCGSSCGGQCFLFDQACLFIEDWVFVTPPTLIKLWLASLRSDMSEMIWVVKWY